MSRQHLDLAVEIDLAAIGLLEQIVNVFGDDVDDIFLERIAFRDRHAFAHRLDRPLGVAAAFLRDALAERCGEVFDLLAHHALDFLAAAGHRMGCADVGARRHRCHVGGQRDEHSGGTGAGAARTDPNHDWHLRAKHFLDDGARRSEQPARSVELNYQGPRATMLRPRYAFADKVIHRRIDAAVDGDQVDMGCRGVVLRLRQHARPHDD